MIELSASPLAPRSPDTQAVPPARKCYCTGEGLEGGEAGIWKKITVFTCNTGGTIKLFSTNADEDLSIYHVTLDHSFGDFGHLKDLNSVNNNDIFQYEIIDQTNSSTIVQYKYSRPGRYILNIRYDGLDISGSPFLIIITPGHADPKACKLINTQKSLITPRNSTMIYNEIILQIRDSNNLIIPHGFHNVSIKADNGVIVNQVIDNMDGTYLIVYAITCADKPTLRVLLDGQDVYGSPVTFNIKNLHQYNQYVLEPSFDDICQSIKQMINEGKLEECEKIVSSNNLNDTLSQMIIQFRRQIYSISTSKYDLIALKVNVIDKMHECLSNDYKDMYNSKTQVFLNLVKSLENIEINDTSSLSNVILTYKNISDELRKLYRYDVANRIDELMKLICDELDLKRISNDLSTKESQIEVQEIALKQKLDLMKLKLEEIKSREFPNDDSLLRHDKVTTTQINAPKLARLLQRRNLATKNPNKQTENSAFKKIDAIVSKFWVKSGVYDIHTTVFNVLKSSPRLNRATCELFKYYTPINWINMINLVIDLRIDRNLQLNPQRLKWLFYKFSSEILDKDKGKHVEIKKEGFSRVIQEFLWVAFLRELAYLNLLYILAGNNPKMLESNRPSRLVSFHHFCNYHFVPLYQKLFYTQEFQTKALVVDGEPQVKEVDVRLMVSDLYKFLNKKLLGKVAYKINLDVLQLIFNHYTMKLTDKSDSKDKSKTYDKRLSSNKKKEPNDKPMTKSAFIRFMWDFGIVPDHMSGKSVGEIISDVEMTFDNFVRKIVSIVSLLVRYYIVNQQQALEDITGPHYTSITVDDVDKQIDYILNLLHLSDCQSVLFAINKLKR